MIPYNSIIDQTAGVFEKLFENNLEILRHQSTFSYDEKMDLNEDYREAAKIAVENWDAPFIITTAVQFFESIYSNKRGKLRKLHNMADSILIFDEAHMMPKNYLQPCLQGIAYITKYLNSEAVFLTATMPDFEKLLELYGTGPDRGKAFEPVPLICKVKRESPATKAQKERLKKLFSMHQLVPEYDVEMYRHKKMKTTPETALEALKAVVREVLYNVWKRSHGRWCFNAICQML